jgi:hypothetical protein
MMQAQSYNLGAKIALGSPTGRRSQFELGELVQWSPLGPGGFPAMSLQGAHARVGAYGDQITLGELIEWTKLGPGGQPPGSLQGLHGRRNLGATEGGMAISAGAMFAAVVGAFGLGYVAAKVMA